MTKRHIASTDSDYESFLKGLGVISLGLDACSARLDRKAYWGLQDRRKDRERSLRAEYKLEKVAKDYFDISAHFTLNVRDAKSSVVVLEVSCSFAGHIHGEPPLKTEHAQRFTDADLRVVVLPYLRQFVSDITSRMSIPPVFVPIALESTWEHEAKVKARGAVATSPSRPA